VICVILSRSEDISSLTVFNTLKFSASSSDVLLRRGNLVKINLTAPTAKKQSTSVQASSRNGVTSTSSSKKREVFGEILGFVKFTYLQEGQKESFGQGYVWYRQVPTEVYRPSSDGGTEHEHVVSTALLNLTGGDGMRKVSPEELESVIKQAPKYVKVELCHHLSACRSSILSADIADDEDGNAKAKEGFTEAQIEEVADGIFTLNAKEPVDITVTVLSKA
jgi:hypothetical protein